MLIPDNHAAAKQDALKLLADFAKANPENLTADQQKQLADILAAQKDGKGVNQAQLNGLIDSLNGSIKSHYTEEVRATGNAPTLPNSSLYNIDPNNPNGYLIETDPAFANYKKWLSSDYMMQRLGLDPSNMHKRLGDGYYEQGLIRDQVMTLTGRRFLGDYTTDDAMYQALMDNGVTVAKAMNLRPGIALTAEQMAQLTTDIVWLVEQTITLKDGSKQTVLAPKVYVRSKVGDLKGDGSLIAARNMDMQFTGDLSNQGNIVAHNGLRISANNLNNQNGGVIQGNFVQINTKNDLNNLGATLKANSAMTIDVGGKLNNSSTTYHTESQAGKSNAWRTGIDQIGQLYVGDGLKGKTDDNGRPLTTLSIDVGGNATFNAGQLINQGGSTRLVAQGDVALNAVNTGYQTNAIKDGNNYTKSGQTQDIGSVVASQGSTYIQSKGGNITGTAVTIHSEDGSSYLDANKDITLKEGRATSNLETAIKTTEKSLLSRKTTQDRNSATSDEAISGNVTGDRVVMQAGNDIQLTATNAISQSGTTLNAGNNLTLDAAQNRYSESSSHNQKKSGLFGNGGASFTLGTQKTANDNRTDSTTHTGSVVGTYNGNTVLTAGDHYQQTGSKVFAQNQTTDNPKDLNYGTTVINAKSANVTNTTATTESHNSQSQKTSGLTVSVSNSLIDQAQGINSLVKAGETTNSDQMKVMAGVAGFSKLRTLKQGIDSAMNPMTVNDKGKPVEKNTEQTLAGMGNTRIQATIGSQSSSSSQDSLSGQNEASTIDTNNLVLNIKGKGKDSDFVLTGSDLNIKGDLYNNVEGDVVYEAATGTGYERSSNKSSGFGVGVYASTGSGAGVTVNANMAKGSGKGDYTTNTNSHVTVDGTTYQNIGGDLVLDGAVVKGDKMTGHIDGAILAKSRQDTATYDGKQVNAGFSADFAGGAPVSVSVNAGGSKINADYAAVKEQTGIAMNSSDVVVSKASRFDGAYFTTATPEDNKTVFKEGVTVTNIENHMNYKGDSINVGLGSGLNPETQKISPPGISGIGYGKDGDSQTSTTYGAVTGMAGKSDVTTANVSSLNKPLENSFDKTAVEAQLGAQVQVSQAFDTERRSYRLEMAKDEEKLRKEAKEAIEKGDEVTWRAKSEQADKQQEKMVLFDSITGAIYGPNTNGVTGYVARAVAPQVSYQIGQYFKGTNGEGTAPHILAHGILAAAVSAATGNDPTTGALSAMGAEASAKYVANYLFPDTKLSELTAEQKATVSSIMSLAGLGLGATTGEVGSAVSAQQAAQVAVDDNALSRADRRKLVNAIVECNKANNNPRASACRQENELLQLSQKNDAFLIKMSQKYSSNKNATFTPDEKLLLLVLADGIAAGKSFDRESVGKLTQGKNSNDAKEIKQRLDKVDLQPYAGPQTYTATSYVNGKTEQRKLVANEVSYIQFISQYNGSNQQKRDEMAFDLALQVMAMTPAGAAADIINAQNAGDYALALAGIVPGVKLGAKAKAAYEAYQVAKREKNAAKMAEAIQDICQDGGQCFTAGTLIETSEGLKPIETFVGGELIWSRNDSTLEYGYRPVIATKVTENQPIFEVVVKDKQGETEKLETTSEHPFWIKDVGWLKASLLDAGMILLDRNNEELEVVSQHLVPNRLETVYNIEVDGFHTYHVGELGIWVHNANCCDLGPIIVNGKKAEVIGTGGNKIAYAIDDKIVIAKLKSGKNIQELQKEIAMLDQLDKLGLPVVKAKITTHDGTPAIIMDRYAQGSKDIVAYNNQTRKVEIKPNADTSLLNERSVKDLKDIKNRMINQKIRIEDLQFLIGKDGSVVISDPLKIHVNTKPSSNNIKMINLLIQEASKK